MRYHHLHITLCCFSLAILAVACNSKAYQNLNARYNGYFYADQYVNEVYQSIENAYDYNFNDILKIYPEIDSSTIQSSSAQLDDAFKKSSQVIEWYPNSDWVDDNYLVIGKIRYLRAQFQYALETFQYVYNKTEDDDARQKALILLMRTYMDMGEIDKAKEVIDYIELEKLSVENTLEYRLQSAYLYQRQGEIEQMREALTDIADYIPEKDLRARAHFILGQLAERDADFPQALSYYDEAIRGTPPYELEFHTKLRQLAVIDVSSEEQIEKAYKTYDRLLDDGKNAEYQDKIFYSMGRLEQRRGDLEKAITHYLLALEVEQPNARTQGLASLRIAQIYFDEYENYQYASVYYDSTVIKLPKDEPGFEYIEQRQLVLKELVTELNIIEKNDSLLNLSELNEVSLDAFLDRYLDERDAQEKAKKKSERPQNTFSGANVINDTPSPNGPSDGTWYFYNIVAQGQGQLEFQQRWGNRQLEDDWRRSRKMNSTLVADNEETETQEQNETNANETLTDRPNDRTSEKERLIATIPSSTEQIEQANQEIAQAYFNCGRIYRFGLEREDLSEQAYLRLLERYPTTNLRLEALYSLYTLNEEKNFNKAEGFKTTIIEDYPDSLIAKLLINPDYLLEKEQRSQALQLVYAEAYDMYESGNYVEADQIVKKALRDFEDVEFLANVELLSAILKGYTESIFSYEQSLVDFCDKYPEGELHNYAKNLLNKLSPAKEEVIRDTDFEFSEDFKQLHLVSVTFSESVYEQDMIQSFIELFNEDNFSKQRLSVGSLKFDESKNITILFVNSFKTKSAAETYNLALTEAFNDLDLPTDANFHNFAISRDNFTLLFEDKKLEEYLAFNKRFYK